MIPETYRYIHRERRPLLSVTYKPPPSPPPRSSRSRTLRSDKSTRGQRRVYLLCKLLFVRKQYKCKCSKRVVCQDIRILLVLFLSYCMCLWRSHTDLVCDVCLISDSHVPMVLCQTRWYHHCPCQGLHESNPILHFVIYVWCIGSYRHRM